MNVVKGYSKMGGGHGGVRVKGSGQVRPPLGIRSRNSKLRGLLQVSFDGRNVFLIITYGDGKKMYQQVGSLREFVPRKGQKISTSMLTSRMGQFLDRVLREIREVPIVVGGISSWMDVSLDVVFKGSSWIRPAIMKTLLGSGAKVLSFTDGSPVAHNGVRAKAKRRI